MSDSILHTAIAALFYSLIIAIFVWRAKEKLSTKRLTALIGLSLIGVAVVALGTNGSDTADIIFLTTSIIVVLMIVLVKIDERIPPKRRAQLIRKDAITPAAKRCSIAALVLWFAGITAYPLLFKIGAVDHFDVRPYFFNLLNILVFPVTLFFMTRESIKEQNTATLVLLFWIVNSLTYLYGKLLNIPDSSESFLIAVVLVLVVYIGAGPSSKIEKGDL